MTQIIKPAPSLTLANGVQMPQLGLGTWPMNDAEAATTVAAALAMGYRLIDTAENYENERGVGEGIRRASVKREDVFVTTKFNRKWHGFEGAR
ncbi:aldo/keto reductase, partial [Zoogloea sp.]|uniref:aldo/keto reductase n=1 Tax=Zoogloea sp. TaxID=49181 RepID=UPI0025D1FB76